MKKFFSLLLALSLALSLTACGGSTDTGDTAADATADDAPTETAADPEEPTAQGTAPSDLMRGGGEGGGAAPADGGAAPAGGRDGGRPGMGG